MPLNIRCSNRCAKPVLPFGSSFDPTLYQTLTATTGALWSSWTITVSPLASLKVVCGIDTCLTSAGIGTDLDRGRAAKTGGVRIVAAASKAKRLAKRISLKSPEKFHVGGAELNGPAKSATALATLVWIFDEPRMSFCVTTQWTQLS